jgi:uncharacterized protein (TIGR02246 family)
MTSANEQEIKALYHTFITAWNERQAQAMADCLAEDGHLIGFDGSQMTGPTEVATTLQQIFAHHATGRYYSKVRGVRFLDTPQNTVALLQAVAGMTPAGQSELNPQLNAVQSLVATKASEGWKTALFQNTPAQFHGRSELVEALTNELQELL